MTWLPWAVALVALAGWTAVLVLLSRSLLPMANSLATLNKVDAAIDDRIARVLGRLRERVAPKPETAPPPAAAAQMSPGEAAIRDLFGSGGGLEPLEDQPEAEAEMNLA